MMMMVGGKEGRRDELQPSAKKKKWVVPPFAVHRTNELGLSSALPRHEWLPSDVLLDGDEDAEQDTTSDESTVDDRVIPIALVAAQGETSENQGDGGDEGEGSEDVDPLHLLDNGTRSGRDVDLP